MAARHLDNWGIPVEVVLVGDPQKVVGVARTHREILERLSVPVTHVSSLLDWNRWTKKSRRHRLVIDALLGTGVSGEVREPIRSVIQWMNRHPCPIVSVDLPSGLSSDTGLPCGVSVKAAVTVTCGLRKVGLSKGQGRAFSGRVVVADISLPRALTGAAWKD